MSKNNARFHDPRMARKANSIRRGDQFAVTDGTALCIVRDMVVAPMCFTKLLNEY